MKGKLQELLDKDITDKRVISIITDIRMSKKYGDKYKIIVRTSQEYSTENGNIFLLFSKMNP